MISSENECTDQSGVVTYNPRDKSSIKKYGITLRNLRNLNNEQLHSCGIFEEPTEKTIIDLTFAQAAKIQEKIYSNT